MHGQVLENDVRPAHAGLAGQQMTGWPGLGELAVGCYGGHAWATDWLVPKQNPLALNKRRCPSPKSLTMFCVSERLLEVSM